MFNLFEWKWERNSIFLVKINVLLKHALIFDIDGEEQGLNLKIVTSEWFLVKSIN